MVQVPVSCDDGSIRSVLHTLAARNRVAGLCPRHSVAPAVSGDSVPAGGWTVGSRGVLHPTEAPTEAERAQTPGPERGQPRDGQSRPVRRDIEGLRSIAVLFVVVYHLGVQRLSGGFAGVDVFFVISGFLITSGLVSEAERTGSVALLRFYARRARRLLPAATLVLVLTAVVGWWVLPRADWSVLSSDVTTAALYWSTGHSPSVPSTIWPRTQGSRPSSTTGRCQWRSSSTSSSRS